MVFVALQERWSKVRLGVEGELEKVYTLLSSEDEAQVRSSFSLLMSLAGSGLCEVLHEADGQLRLRRETVLHHHLLLRSWCQLLIIKLLWWRCS